MAESNPFVHLHVHTEYSMLDGLNKIPDLAARTKELGMEAVAMTDHGVMHGAVEFVNAAKANDIKPIMGVEAYISKDHKNKSGSFRKTDDGEKLYYHLTLLAKNFTGYKNLLSLVSIANVDGMYYKPRIDKKLLKDHREGLIALSGCYGGEIPGAFWRNRNDKEKGMAQALKIAEEYDSIFGDDFYIELQRQTSTQADQDYMDPLLQELARKMNKKMIASGDVHYLRQEDAKIQDIFWAIQEGRTIYDPKHKPMTTDQLYLKSPEEMYELFSDVPEAPRNTNEVADKVESYSLAFERVQPKFPDTPEGETAQTFLKKLTYEGVVKRYGKMDDKTKKRVDYELEIIHDKGYDDYFLVVADYINWARSQDILVGPGRGSGAGSVVAYAMGITDIDPFWWGLQFERFLNPERPSPPDFDIDFQDDRREEVIRYLERKYGSDHVAAIITIGRMDTKAAIRDVSRALDIPLDQADKVAKMIPVKRGKPMKVKEAMETIPEFADFINADPKLTQMIDAVKGINKIARNVSVHACGYLVTPDPLVEYVPLRRAPQNNELIITQIEGSYIEKVGLMKFDFLGLRTLSIIKNAQKAIEKQHNIKIDLDLDKMDMEDEKTFRLFQKAYTDGVFQFESTGMKKYLRDLVPTNVEDICFMCAAYRPGPMQYIPDYIERKHGRAEIEYLHPDMESIVGDTMGYAIYQEQVMSIAVEMAGYSLGRADLLRRAMGKKKKEILDKEKPYFMEGMKKNGYSQDLAEEIFAFLMPFADYGFNKSHSACYAVIAYQTAFLKAHHPIEFIVGQMQSDMGHTDKLEADLNQAQAMHVEVLPPDINESDLGFAVARHDDELEEKWLDDDIEDVLQKRKALGKYHYIGSIRYGLSGIKGASQKALEAIVEARNEGGDFKHLDDLLSRVDVSRVNKKTLLLLAQSGAFDKWGDRNAFIALIPTLYDRYKAEAKAANEAQISLFGSDDESDKLISATPLPQVEPASVTQILAWEKDLFGVYVTSHPLKQYSQYFMSRGVMSLDEASIELPSGDIMIGVQVVRMKKLNTKKGDMMAFIDIEDTTGQVSGVLFPRTYEEFAKILAADEDALNKPFLMKGRIDKRLDKVSFVVNKFEVLDAEKVKSRGKRNSIKKIELKLDKGLSKEDLSALKQFLAANEGEVGLSFMVPNATGFRKVAYKKGIKYNYDLKKTLRRFGEIKEEK